MDTCDMIHEHKFKDTMNKLIDLKVSDKRERAVTMCKTMKGDVSLSQVAVGTENSVMLPECSQGARVATFHTHDKSPVPSPTDTFNIIRYTDMYQGNEHHCIGLRDTEGNNKIACYNYKHKPIIDLLMKHMIDDEVPLPKVVQVVNDIDSDIKDNKGKYVDSCSVQ